MLGGYYKKIPRISKASFSLLEGGGYVVKKIRFRFYEWWENAYASAGLSGESQDFFLFQDKQPTQK